FGGTTADQADRALAVGRRRVGQFVRRISFACEAIFKDKGGDAVISEAFGFVQAFMHDPYRAMAAAGGDDDGGAGGFVVRRQVNGDRGIMFVGDCVFVVGFVGFDFFLILVFLGSRRSIGPERDFGMIVGGRRVSEQEKRDKRCAEEHSS